MEQLSPSGAEGSRGASKGEQLRPAAQHLHYPTLHTQESSSAHLQPRGRLGMEKVGAESNAGVLGIEKARRRREVPWPGNLKDAPLGASLLSI